MSELEKLNDEFLFIYKDRLNDIIEFKKGQLCEDDYEGILLKSNCSWLLLQEIKNSRFDGFSVHNHWDITSLIWDELKYPKLRSKLKQEDIDYGCEIAQKIDFEECDGEFNNILKSVNANFPAISIFLEKNIADEFFVLTDLDFVSDEAFIGSRINTDGEIDGKIILWYANVTSIRFGSSYENMLTR